MEGPEIAAVVRRKAEAFRKACVGIDEETASRAPAERWSPKQIVSHLCGPEGRGPVMACRAFVEQDVPKLDLQPGNPFFSEARARISFAALLGDFDKVYDEVAEFVGSLTLQQLGRKAHVPDLKDSPLGEYPTLEAFVLGIGEFHVQFHIDHLREILEALGKAPKG